MPWLRCDDEAFSRTNTSATVTVGPFVSGTASTASTSWLDAARSRYHLFNTCNTWVARALQRAGLDVASAGTLTASGVMHQARGARAGLPVGSSDRRAVSAEGAAAR